MYLVTCHEGSCLSDNLSAMHLLCFGELSDLFVIRWRDSLAWHNSNSLISLNDELFKTFPALRRVSVLFASSSEDSFDIQFDEILKCLFQVIRLIEGHVIGDFEGMWKCG